MAMAETHKSGTGRYVVVYIFILAIAALQFVHLSDNHSLLWFVVIFTVFVLLAMQYGWTDSFRVLLGAPWSNYTKY
jgi:glucose-6-phosphate-specific signal transduction histidine kinase